MKLSKVNQFESIAPSTKTFKNACAYCAQKVLTQIARTKNAIFNEWRVALANEERLLRLALNEAEASAWQTMVPHLVFPTLAVEKVQEVAAWSRRQEEVRNNHLHVGNW